MQHFTAVVIKDGLERTLPVQAVDLEEAYALVDWYDPELEILDLYVTEDGYKG